MDSAALAIERSQLDLIGAAMAGDTSAFDLLVRQHARQVFRLALRMLGNREDAEDVQQETFVRAHQRLRSFRGECSFGTWLYAIASRLCVSARRRRAAMREQNIAGDPADRPSLNEDLEQKIVAQDSARRVQRSLLALSPPDRLLIVLRYVEGLSHAEIARVLQCSVESSRSRLARAKRLFRQQYERVE
jgi:RNA polymerase sigma-70 factor (ECF subfamily)